MAVARRREHLPAVAALGVLGAILLVRLAAFGIWDPWELTAADDARRWMDAPGEATDGAPLGRWLVGAGFALFGVREWAGRLPIALSGLVAVLVAYALVARFADRRAALYAAIATGSTPLFVLNARQMLGDAPAFACQALVALAAASAVYAPTRRPDATDASRSRATYRWLGLLVAAILLGTLARGALLAVLPPLLAVSAAAAFDGTLLRPAADPRRSYTAWIVAGLTIALGVTVLRDVVRDAAEYSAWLGGRPRGGSPPTFEVALERIFHSLAPWSGLVPVALARLLLPRDDGAGVAHPSGGARPAEHALGLIVPLWAALGYAALTLFTARYGDATYLPVVAVGAAVALLLRDAERAGGGAWGAAVIAALLGGLLVREYALYPASPAAGLPAADLTVPETFNPRTVWAPLLAGFVALSALALGARTPLGAPDLAAPWRAVWLLWRRRGAARFWLAAAAFGAACLLAAGALAWLAPSALALTTIAERVLRIGGLVPLALPIAVAAGQLALHGVGRLGPWRSAPLLVAALAVGAYTAQGFLPSLSAHLSPREVYDTYRTLARPDEPLGEYRIGGRAAAYYAGAGRTRELKQQGELIDFLLEPGRNWVSFPADELASINRAYRRRTREHLFVVDARSARVVLATDEPVAGRENESFVARHVLSSPPPFDHPVDASFEDKIELLGYSLTLPHDGYVGAGESFTITWVYRVLREVSGSWKVFLHVDGQGLRLNGDHDPVDGKYPVRLWDPGDIVVDVQPLKVPANYRAGEYGLYVGFFSGNTRLDVVRGPEDSDKRVRAGTLMIR